MALGINKGNWGVYKLKTFNEYQKAAHSTSKNTRIGDTLVYPVLGLASESGELAGKIKKLWRDHDGARARSDSIAIKKELGDCLWYIAEIATQLGESLEDIAEMNIEKLADRTKRGAISGSGDDR